MLSNLQKIQEDDNEHLVCAQVAPNIEADIKYKGQTIVEKDVEESDDLHSDDGGSKEEERIIVSHSERSIGPLVRFPMHEKYMKGYIWKMDFLFNVKIANV